MDFATLFGEEPTIRAWAPGRVNLIGEHTDYNDGLVLPAAIDRGVRVLARARPDRQVSLHSGLTGETVTFEIGNRAAAPWARLPAGLAAMLADRLPGMDLLVTSDLPVGAGLSSSAAYAMALLAAYQGIGSFALEPLQAATMAQRAEWEYTGVRCGIMDQAAAGLGRTDHALLLDCRDLSFRHVPIPDGIALLICHSGVPRELAGSAYNERRRECEKAVAALHRHDPAIRSLRDVHPDRWREMESQVPEPARRRARHVITENARVIAAADALSRADLPALADLFAASHRSLRDDYDVSSPELDALVGIAGQVSPLAASRLTGAGFGGCTIHLLPPDLVPELERAILEVYPARTGREPMLLRVRAADGAGWEEAA
ncbi:MAG TPA: galactokinase [Chloroflexota bacterium]|nr:galactokinase [Chloroflexota bacterium]